MVHVGLAAFEDSIRIEQVARHGPYMHKDVDQQAPHEDLRLFYEKHTATGEDTASGDSSCAASAFNLPSGSIVVNHVLI